MPVCSVTIVTAPASTALILAGFGATGVALVVWARFARRRTRYDGSVEPRSTFRARRILLAFEGAVATIAACLGLVLTDALVDVFFALVMALFVAPLLFALFSPGVFSGRYGPPWGE